MREIKFRAWEAIRQRMIYPKNETFYGHIVFTPEEENDMDKCEDTIPIFMQYTGLKDKNGKEIYDGDICRLDGEEADNYDTGDVCWCADGWIFSNSYTNESLSVYCKRLKVLGNIYENPELLKASR